MSPTGSTSISSLSRSSASPLVSAAGAVAFFARLEVALVAFVAFLAGALAAFLAGAADFAAFFAAAFFAGAFLAGPW